jgi:hypothetical protein
LLAGVISFAQTVEEVVAKHIAAIGGADNWKKVNSMVIEGAVNVMGTDVSIKVTQEHNKGTRQDISVAGMNGFVITTPTEGWTFIPFQGQQKPEPMTADDIKESLDDLDIQGSLLDYKAKGHIAELLGTEEIEGSECYKVKVTRKNSGEQTYFIDKSSYMIIRSVTKRKAMGQEMDMNVDYSDYREVEGVKVPFGIGQGGLGTMVVSSVKINQPIAADTFSTPK